uniref:Uncharacterized protein n=1 Tax=Bracon brevicornis TaxID=1563983 RepID=A0A6V7L3V8_9HYME
MYITEIVPTVADLFWGTFMEKSKAASIPAAKEVEEFLLKNIVELSYEVDPTIFCDVLWRISSGTRGKVM